MWEWTILFWATGGASHSPKPSGLLFCFKSFQFYVWASIPSSIHSSTPWDTQKSSRNSIRYSPAAGPPRGSVSEICGRISGATQPLRSRLTTRRKCRRGESPRVHLSTKEGRTKCKFNQFIPTAPLTPVNETAKCKSEDTRLQVRRGYITQVDYSTKLLTVYQMKFNLPQQDPSCEVNSGWSLWKWAWGTRRPTPTPKPSQLSSLSIKSNFTKARWWLTGDYQTSKKIRLLFELVREDTSGRYQLESQWKCVKWAIRGELYQTNKESRC